MNSLRPVCARCSVEMACKANSVDVRVSQWGVCSGDLYECPSCGAEVITGFGKSQPALVGERYWYDLTRPTPPNPPPGTWVGREQAKLDEQGRQLDEIGQRAEACVEKVGDCLSWTHGEPPDYHSKR